MGLGSNNCGGGGWMDNEDYKKYRGTQSIKPLTEEEKKNKEKKEKEYQKLKEELKKEKEKEIKRIKKIKHENYILLSSYDFFRTIYEQKIALNIDEKKLKKKILDNKEMKDILMIKKIKNRWRVSKEKAMSIDYSIFNLESKLPNEIIEFRKMKKWWEEVKSIDYGIYFAEWVHNGYDENISGLDDEYENMKEWYLTINKKLNEKNKTLEDYQDYKFSGIV